MTLTPAHIPTQVPKTVEGVEGEWRGKDDLAGVLDGVGEARDELDDVRRVEGGGCNEVGERVAVQHFILMNGGGYGIAGGYSQTLRAAPVIRLAIEATQVSWGW